MEKLIEHMIQIVESNAKNNQATIPDVESWAIAWRDEVSKESSKQQKTEEKIIELKNQLRQSIIAYNMLEEYLCELLGHSVVKENDVITQANKIIQTVLNAK